MATSISLAGGTLHIHLRPELTAIEREEREVGKWDLEGRPLSLQTEGVYFRRGISHRCMVRGRFDRTGRILPEEEARSFLGRMERLASDAHGLFLGERGEGVKLPEAARRLSKIGSIGHAALEDEGRRFLSVYRPVPILPPDRLLSFVIQVTEGCPWNRCSFCGLYPDTPFRARTGEDLEAHLDAALALFGEGIRIRNSLFLGDGDPFVLPDDRLLPLVDRIRSFLAAAERRGRPMPASQEIYSFARISSLRSRSAGDLAHYRERGFRRLYIGVETGDAALYRILKKPGSLGDLPGAVERIHAAGLGVGLIFLVGVGGERFRESHRRETVRLLSTLPLCPRDLVYLSPFVLHPGTAYAGWAAKERIEPFPREETAEEAKRIASGALEAGVSAKAAYYPLEHFVY